MKCTRRGILRMRSGSPLAATMELATARESELPVAPVDKVQIARGIDA